jgi:hypothetical protein
MIKATLVAFVLISWQVCFAEPLPEGPFSVTVISSSGKPVEAPQVYLVTKEGIFQKGVAGKDGVFIFKMPPKSAYLFAAAHGFEGEKVTYSGQKTISITMKESSTRNSAIGDPSLTLEGKGGRINVNSSNWMTCSGISFPETKRHTATKYYLNRPVTAVDADSKRFKIYVKDIISPICLVEYTR